MTQKRFTIRYTDETKMMQYVDNQKEEPNAWAICNARETAQKLNALHEENQHIKNTIHDMIQTERTQIGQSVLKQLMERIQ